MPRPVKSAECTLGKHHDTLCRCGGYMAKQCCEYIPGPCRKHGCGVRVCKCPKPEAVAQTMEQSPR